MMKCEAHSKDAEMVCVDCYNKRGGKDALLCFICYAEHDESHQFKKASSYMKTLAKVKESMDCWGSIAQRVDSVTDSSQRAVSELERNMRKIVHF